MACHDFVENQGSAFHDGAVRPNKRGNGSVDTDVESRSDQPHRPGCIADPALHTGVCDQFWSALAAPAGRSSRRIQGATALGLELISARLLRYIGTTPARRLETRRNSPPCYRRFFRETPPNSARSDSGSSA